MKTQAVVVADDPVYVSWLENSAGQGAEFSLVRPLDAEDLIERVQMMGRIDVAFFQFEAANLDSRISMMERLAERMPDLPLAGLGADSNPDIVLAAMRAGARDFLVLRRDEGDVSALLSKLLRRTVPTARASAKEGQLFGVFGPHPSESIAFVAEHLALAVQSQLPRSEQVLFIDVAAPAGAGAIFLNITQAYSVLDAINDVYRCDQTLIDTAFSKHASGLYLLSLPEDLIGAPAANFDEFIKLLKVLRGLFAAVVVSFDGHLPLPTLAGILTQADRSVLLSDQSIMKSRHSKYLLRALRLEDCPLDRTALVVDQYQRRLGLEPENLAEILDLPVLGTLAASAGHARAQAMNAGEPLFATAPKDPFCADVRRLATALMTAQPRMERANAGLLGRLLG